ncbi:MAG: hypothetical protein GC192_03600 [Bacteroidetes bacterium]|nr:hypothetical protein [Bacteroidota bacterium]
MDTANLLFLIKSFSKTEARDVRRFLASPFFNTREDLCLLFDFIYENENPQKEAAWQHISPETAYDDTAMRLLMSYLNRLLERFLVFYENEEDPMRNKLKLAVAYRRRGLAGQYSRHLNALEKQLETQPLRNGHYHQMMRDLAFEKQRTQTTSNPTDTATNRQVIETTDVHYLATRMRLLCLEAAQKGVYRSKETESTDRDIVALAKQEKWATYPAVVLYLRAYEMLTQPENDGFYHQYKDMMVMAEPAFSSSEMKECYLFAINYCIRRLNEGNKAFGLEAVQLYRSALEGGFLLENGILSRFTYHNIVGAALATGELIWAREFIHQYQDQLEKKYREGTYSFNLARLEMAVGNYDSVLELLQKASYKDPLPNLAAKTLLLKTCYHLGEFDLLQSHLDAMRNYIHRSEVIGYHRTNYLNFIRYLDKVLQVNRLEKKAVEKLRQQIQNEKVLTEKGWLLEKLD